MALGTHIKLDLRATLSDSLDLGVRTFPSVADILYDWGSGVGLNQADKMFSDERTLAGVTGEDLDVAGGLTDAFGVTLTLAKIKALLVHANGTQSMFVSRPANGVPIFEASGDRINLQVGGSLLWVAPSLAGVAVTAGTGDLIHVENIGISSTTYRVVIIGTSA